MAVRLRKNNGKVITLLNPAEKGKKYAFEMKHKKAFTNSGQKKIDKTTGKQVVLTKTQRAFRAGYLSAQKDSSKCFKSIHPRYRRKSRVV